MSTESSSAAKLKQEKRDTNAFIVNVCILVMAVIGLLYMTDANTLIAGAIGWLWAAIYNGIGSLAGYADTSPAIVASNVKLILLILFSVSGIGGLWANQQNR